MMDFFRRHTIVIAFALLISILINISQYNILKNNKMTTSQKSDPASLDDTAIINQVGNKFFDNEYKLFYGEWEITEYINYTGHTSMSAFKIEEGLGHPVLESDQQYLGLHSTSVKNLGIKGDYFNYVSILDKNNIYVLSNDIIGNTFYVVDNNTLILEYAACEFIMKRSAFIDSAKMFELEHN